MLTTLGQAVELRRQRPGAIAEMLEPDLKEGGGGLRDVQSLEWAGWALGAPGGAATLLERGFLSEGDRTRIDAGRELLLDIRVALQRVTNAHSDRLALQEHDAVADQLRFDSADALVHDLASAAREIAWIAGDAWSRILDDTGSSDASSRVDDDPVALGVWIRDGRVHIEAEADGSVPTLRTLEAACAAAESAVPFDRASLAALRDTGAPTWDVWQRAGFVRLLRSGGDAVPVFEALDHEGVLARLLPEWEHVRSLPQRNAYHRYTVDRHLLEAVAQCARLLDAGEVRIPPGREPEVEAVVARARAAVRSSCCSARCCTTSPKADPATTPRWGSGRQSKSCDAWVSTARRARSCRGSSAITCSWRRWQRDEICPTRRCPTTLPPPARAMRKGFVCSICSRSATRRRPGPRPGTRRRPPSCATSS